MNPDATSLDRLHDLVVPPPVPWWPPTPGWLIVIAAAALCLLAWIVKRVMAWQANRYRREALALLDEMGAGELSNLVKRVALAAWPREDVARLTGGKWLEFLDRSAGLDLFVAGPGAELEKAAFDPGADLDEAPLRSAVREWIVKHRKEEPA